LGAGFPCSSPSYNGTAPIDVSSGDQVRHRLSSAGNRGINQALHMMAVTQIPHPGTVGRQHYERRPAGDPAHTAACPLSRIFQPRGPLASGFRLAGDRAAWQK